MLKLLKRLIGRAPVGTALEKHLRHRFKDPEMLLEALTHSSYAREHKGASDNERLEFLGDAVLQLIATDRVYENEKDREGDMSKARSALVCGEGLLHIADRIGLSEHIRLGWGEEKAGGARKKKILEDAVEAVIGALYLDGGLRPVRKFLDACWDEIALPSPTDHKSDAQVFFQRSRRATPRYTVVGTSGPAHARRFKVRMLIGSEVVSEGEGSSIKAAEQAAARRAIEMSGSVPEKPAGGRPTHKTRAHEYYARLSGATPRYQVVETTGPAHARRYQVEMKVGRKIVGRGEGTSIRAAEQAAAKQAIEAIEAGEPGQEQDRAGT